MQRGFLSGSNHTRIKGLSEPDDIGPQRRAAVSTVGRAGITFGAGGCASPAARAAIAMKGSVNLEWERGLRILDAQGICCVTGGPVMQAVDVLGHECDAVATQRQSGERVVARVGCTLGDEPTTPLIPFPYQGWITLKGLGRGQLLRSVGSPQPTLATKRGYTRLGGHSGTCEDEDPLSVLEHRARLLDELGHWVGHALQALQASRIQPAIRATPPMGVIAPSQR